MNKRVVEVHRVMVPAIDNAFDVWYEDMDRPGIHKYLGLMRASDELDAYQKATNKLGERYGNNDDR